MAIHFNYLHSTDEFLSPLSFAVCFVGDAMTGRDRADYDQISARHFLSWSRIFQRGVVEGEVGETGQNEGDTKIETHAANT